jgi:quercetin dioxygenase-like cupin family protein
MNFIVTLLFSLTLLSSATAQAPVAIQKEPRHQLEFQNGCVRLFNVRIPPGDSTLFHTHENDNVGVKLTDAELNDVIPGGDPARVLVKRGAVAFGHYPTPLIHSVSNVGNTLFHNTLVEVLPSKGLPSNAATLADVAGYTLEIENERVRIFRLVIAPGQSTHQHSHALHGMSVVITEGKIAVGLPGTATEIVLFKPGDYRWHQGGVKHSLTNVGSANFEVVVIELKQSDLC